MSCGTWSDFCADFAMYIIYKGGRAINFKRDMIKAVQQQITYATRSKTPSFVTGRKTVINEIR